MEFRDLIDKLAVSHKGFFLRDHWAQLKDDIKDRDVAEIGTKEFTDACESVSNQYNMIYGFLWGLYTAGSITQRERGDLTGELCKECGYK